MIYEGRALLVGVITGIVAMAVILRLTLLHHIPNWNPLSVVISGILIILASIDWWALDLVRISARRDGGELRALRNRFLLTTLSATGIGLIGLNYLLGGVIPSGSGLGLMLLIVSLVLVSAPQVLFLHRYYRPLTGGSS